MVHICVYLQCLQDWKYQTTALNILKSDNFCPKIHFKNLTTEVRSKTGESLNLIPSYLTDWATRKVVKFCTNKIYLLKYRFHCVLWKGFRHIMETSLPQWYWQLWRKFITIYFCNLHTFFFIICILSSQDPPLHNWKIADTAKIQDNELIKKRVMNYREKK